MSSVRFKPIVFLKVLAKDLRFVVSQIGFLDMIE